MDSFEHLFERVYALGLAHGAHGCGKYPDQLTELLRRVALVEAIRGCRLEWDKRFTQEIADTEDVKYILHDEAWGCFRQGTANNLSVGKSGKDGAQRDYWRRLAAAFEGQFPGITEDATND